MVRTDFLELSVQSLEPRSMLAGNVTAAVTGGGDLVLRGDNLNNEVVVLSGDEAGLYVVRGVDGTTIEGQSEVTVDGVTDDLRIMLRNGDNQLSLVGLDVPDDLVIRSGNGQNVIVTHALNVQDDVSIATKGGNDEIWIGPGQISDNFTIRTAGGDDMVTIMSGEIGGRLSVLTGSGNDSGIINGAQFGDGSRYRLGGGDDRLGLFSLGTNIVLNGGHGVDQVNPNVAIPRSGFEQENVLGAAAVLAHDLDTGYITRSHVIYGTVSFYGLGHGADNASAYANTNIVAPGVFTTTSASSNGLALATAGVDGAFSSSGDYA